jgi:alkyl sulfatase BDS1-like metallo-beta-lactamase superfamily hydrolase
MSCAPTSPELTLTAGQVSALPLTFKNPDGTPLDLTGSTVTLTVKKSLSDADADAVIALSTSAHTDAAAGETSLDIDLSEAPAKWFAQGERLTGSIWVEDDADQHIPYGLLTVRIVPSALGYPVETP